LDEEEDGVEADETDDGKSDEFGIWDDVPAEKFIPDEGEER
jgi:hypothetical protein